MQHMCACELRASTSGIPVQSCTELAARCAHACTCASSCGSRVASGNTRCLHSTFPAKVAMQAPAQRHQTQSVRPCKAVHQPSGLSSLPLLSQTTTPVQQKSVLPPPPPPAALCVGPNKTQVHRGPPPRGIKCKRIVLQKTPRAQSGTLLRGRPGERPASSGRDVTHDSHGPQHKPRPDIHRRCGIFTRRPQPFRTATGCTGCHRRPPLPAQAVQPAMADMHHLLCHSAAGPNTPMKPNCRNKTRMCS